jgi:hypothetical protein
MLRYTAVLAVVLFSSASFYAPPAQALPTWSTWTIYYDGNQDYAGSSYRSCSGSWQQDGTLAGVWKEVDRDECGYPWQSTVEYFHYCNGVWVQVGAIGDPSC